MKRIDLNCDMGEIPAAIDDGTQESLMPFLSSVNVACGGHAGDENSMKKTVEQALRWKLAIGAHPSYPDREHFGRKEQDWPAETVADFVCEQVRTLDRVAASCGARLAHVKPHGALYNQAARDPVLARAIAAGVARCHRDVILVGLASSSGLGAYSEAGFEVAAEAFADRRYEADGTLRSRQHEDALIAEPDAAARQALSIAESGRVVAYGGAKIAVNAQTICIHGDSPGAPEIAAAVARTLRAAGIQICSLGSLA
jgi:5-oxoprolinase (ATP-hydrolysing) subunit A